MSPVFATNRYRECNFLFVNNSNRIQFSSNSSIFKSTTFSAFKKR